MREEVRDPLHAVSSPDSLWTTTNVSEAAPGVATPLSWSFWGDATERAIRGTFYTLGALARKRDTAVPDRLEECAMGVFFGRGALRVDFLARMADRMPGTSGAAVAEQIFSGLPEGFVSKPQRRYYPLVAVKLPAAMVRVPRELRKIDQRTEELWRSELSRISTADADEARRSFGAAVAAFRKSTYVQVLCLFAVVQPVYDQLSRLVAAAGGGGSALMAGYGSHEETQLLADLWECSRGRLDMSTFLDRHGFHGPREGEMSAVAWREDPSPVLQILESYRAMGEETNPAAAAARRVAARERAERELLGSLSPIRRAMARIVLRLARRCIPLRGPAKVAFLRSLDVARAAARRLGECLATDGALDDPEDVFFLTVDELLSGQWEGCKSRIAERRARHRDYQGLRELPATWQGMPERPQAVSPPSADDASREGDTDVIEGVGASAGVAEGWVRVVTHPGEDDMEAGEILVAHTTDPSWVSVLFMSSALVIDIGGHLSHAAVVARELGVPCVAGTKVGTRLLRTGDRCRVDGTNGRVEVLERVKTSA